MKILVTGAAGFIGYHLTRRLLERGDTVIGLDNINDYYDINLKYSRLTENGILRQAENWHIPVQSIKFPRFTFIRMDLEDREAIFKLFKQEKFDKVCNLAAQAGVRYSLENPYAFIKSNVVGFINMLEACRHHNIKHLVYASSSSVYGNNTKMPFSTTDNVDHPVSLYAATKKSNELMAYTYTNLYGLPTTGLRFFTVYGPWGRPDMSFFLFTKAIIEGRPIKVFNNGNMVRDFTFIDDIIEGVIRVIDDSPVQACKMSGEKNVPYKIYNIGSSSPVQLMEYVSAIEASLGMTAKKEFLPMQPGDVARTEADVTDLIADLNYKPCTPLQVGIDRFIQWYRRFYNV